MILLASCNGKVIQLPAEALVDAITTTQPAGMNEITNLALDGEGLVFAADPSRGVYVFDTSDSINVTLRGMIPFKADDITFMTKTYVAMVTSGKLAIADVNDPANPEIIYTSPANLIAPGPFAGLSYHNGILAVANAWAGVHFFDVTNPYAPVLTSTYVDKNCIGLFDVALTDMYAFISGMHTTGLTEVIAVNYTNGAPFKLGSYSSLTTKENSLETPGHFSQTSLYFNESVWFIDQMTIKAKNGPGEEEVEANYLLRNQPIDLAVGENLTLGLTGDVEGFYYYADLDKTIHFILTTKGKARAATFANDIVYVADGANGLMIVDVKKIQDLLKTESGLAKIMKFVKFLD
jgi:hypothetical protein